MADTDVIDLTASSPPPPAASSRKRPPPQDDDERDERTSPRKLYEFLIRLGIRLEAMNTTTCSAIMVMHRIRESSLAKHVCNYTLATAAIHITSMHAEDLSIGIRDVVNASHRILHPDEERLKVDERLWKMRQGVAKLGMAVLREVAFDLEFEHPFNTAAIYLDLLRSWQPNEFERYPIVESVMTLLRDCYVAPDFVELHSTSSLAITAISIVLKGHKVDIEYDRDWFERLHKKMTYDKLKRLEEEMLERLFSFKKRRRD